MNPDKTPQNLFNEALERDDPVERAGFLDEACGADAALRERVEKLLRAHAEAAGFMAQPSRKPAGLELGQTVRVAMPLTEKPGDKIGRYKLLQQIGEGGCGVVYMAEQEEPVRRRVAVKVLKLGMDTKQVIARFEAERQALAMMDHPNIAKVFDAGATETGRPYFVMELVRGVKMTEFCDEKELSTQQRLDLFLKVCSAIQHAHQKGIIHRDVKPSNILVTVVDGVAVPKVIDFGIAKATNNQPLTNKTLFTAFEQFIGTPAYMSPEQAELSGVDIDTRTDIYSLGVVLYELLTGGPPFDQKKLLAAGLDAMRRTIREEEPPRPSNRLSTMAADELTTAAQRRHTEPPKLIYQVRGDLDWIVMKCLEKDRARRYETANGLAMDIRRHVYDEPVVARPPSRLYEFQKTVRRHKFGFAAAGAVIVALAIGFAISTWQFVQKNLAYERAAAAEQEQIRLRQQAEANQKKAETEATKSRQVASFLEDMLKGVNPEVALGRDTTMLRAILDRTAERVGKDLKDQPEVQAELRSTIGHIYHELGDFRKAKEMHDEALRLRRACFGETNLWVAASLSDVAFALQELGNLSESETTQRAALAMRKQMLSGDHLDVAISLDRLADVLFSRNKLSESETTRRESLQIRRRLLGNDSVEVADSLNDLSMTLTSLGQLEAAEAVTREALAICRKLPGGERPSLATSHYRLCRVLLNRGRLDEAETCGREALASRRRLLGNEHPYTHSAMELLTSVLRSQHKYAEAIVILRELHACRKKRYGEESADALRILLVIASTLKEAGDLTETETTYEGLIRLYRTRLERLRGQEGNVSASVPSTLGVALHHLAAVQLQRKAPEQARTNAEEAWLLYQQHPDWPENERHHASQVLQTVLTALDDQPALETLQSNMLVHLRAKYPPDDPQLAAFLAGLAHDLLKQQKFTEAEGTARESLVIRERSLPDDWLTSNSRSLLGGSLLGQMRYAEAEPLLLSGYEGMKQREASIPPGGKVRIPEALQRLAQLYEATGQSEKAAECNQKLAEFDKGEAEK